MPEAAAPASSAPAASRTHLVLIPSYNPGPKVRDTVAAARARWNPVWVVIDGSTDGSAAWLQDMAAQDEGLRVLALPANQGKGAAVLHGIEQAAREGFTHALTLDSDGQHPAHLIPAFMQASQARPDAMVLGVPQFGAEAPRIRVLGRKISNGWANLETLGAGIGDSLFGFRVYPIAPLARVMRGQRFMRRFDFDPEAAVRLAWQACPPSTCPLPCATSRPKKAASPTSNTCATTPCSPGCTPACSWALRCACPAWPGSAGGQRAAENRPLSPQAQASLRANPPVCLQQPESIRNRSEFEGVKIPPCAVSTRTSCYR